MNRIALGILIGVLAVVAFSSPTALARFVAHLRETGETIVSNWANQNWRGKALFTAIKPSRAPSQPKGRNWKIGCSPSTSGKRARNATRTPQSTARF